MLLGWQDFSFADGGAVQYSNFAGFGGAVVNRPSRSLFAMLPPRPSRESVNLEARVGTEQRFLRLANRNRDEPLAPNSTG